MKNKINILVTGCGGDIGQSIGKILHGFEFAEKVYGCDISDKNAAKFIYPNFFTGLPCSHEKYIDKLEGIIKEKEIDLVIPVAEPELRFYSTKNITEDIGNAKILIASSKALEIGFDKLKTAEFLKQENLPFPDTTLIKSVGSIEKWPIIVKSRTGSGSSNVHIVKNMEAFSIIKQDKPDYIIQEYLSGDNGEFTCGVFRNRLGVVRSIILKRELMGGFSGYGEVIENNEIDFILHEIANRLNLIGSINIQLRITEKGPVVFEINPRFSSTVRFRHMLGFKDLEWAIKDKFEIKLPDYINNSVGKEFFKGFNEYIS